MWNKFIVLTVLSLAPALADSVQLQFTSVNGANAFGFYVGPYYGQLESRSVSLYCDDFANEVAFGQIWEANLTKITAGSDLSNTRYGATPDALANYQKIAWLDSQFAVQPTTQYGDIHATIWSIFDPQDAPKPSSDQWLTLAEESYRSMTYDNFRVVTNVGPVLPTGQVQEFLMEAGPIANASTVGTPEPATALLMGTGLLLAAGFTASYRRSRAPKPVRFGT